MSLVNFKIDSDSLPNTSEFRVFRNVEVSGSIAWDALRKVLDASLAEKGKSILWDNLNISIRKKSVTGTQSPVSIGGTMDFQTGDNIIITTTPKNMKAGAEKEVTEKEMDTIDTLLAELSSDEISTFYAELKETEQKIATANSTDIEQMEATTSASELEDDFAF